MVEQDIWSESEVVLDTLPVEAIERNFSWLNNQQEADSEETDSIAEIERIGFQIADMHLVCSFSSISEIADIPGVYRVPHLPPWVAGAASLRGEVAPVIDLAAYLNLERHTAPAKLVMIGHDDERAGLLVDGRPDIYYFSAEQQLKTDPPLATKLLPYLKTAYQQDNVIWLELDIPALINIMIE